jgi:hypothetical protein
MRHEQFLAGIVAAFAIPKWNELSLKLLGFRRSDTDQKDGNLFDFFLESGILERQDGDEVTLGV